MSVRVRELEPAELPSYGARLAAIEGEVDYPLGRDRFRIDHGDDYFAFFRRLGELHYFVAERGAEILGVLAAIRRQLGIGETWYLCDLKAFDVGRGLLLSRRLLHGLREIAGAMPGYGVSMSPAAGPNRTVALTRRLAPDVATGPRLVLYSFGFEAMSDLAPLVTAQRGRLAYLGLTGLKDIVLASTGAPMPLLHVQHGQCAEPAAAEPVPGHEHMLCCPAEDALDLELRGSGHHPTATAVVLQRGLPELDWSFVLTSDI